jgi:hypothetical protein
MDERPRRRGHALAGRRLGSNGCFGSQEATPASGATAPSGRCFSSSRTCTQTLAISHYGYMLSKGRVVAAGTPAELADRAEVREAYFG